MTKDAQFLYNAVVNEYRFEFDKEKDLALRETRSIGFKEIIEAILNNKTLDDYEHPKKSRYPNQRILIVEIKNYAYAVPYVENKKRKTIFLKTVYPSRVLTKKYLKGGKTK